MTASTSSKHFPPTLMPISEAPSNCSIVFLPDVGGNVFYALELVRALKGDAECYGARLSPDMAIRLKSLTVDGICKQFASDIAKADIAGPIHLVGFSFAAFFAAETARQLSMLGAAPERLWIIDMPATHRIGFVQIIKFLRLSAGRMLSEKKASRFLHKPGFIRLDLSNHPEPYHEILQSFYAILTTFKPRPWNGNATIVVSESRELPPTGPHDLGWSEFFNGNLTTCISPGNHLSMLYDQKNAEVLSKHFQSYLPAIR